VVLLSFGIVQIPRSFWNLGDRRRTLRMLEFQATQIKGIVSFPSLRVTDNLNDADAELDDLVRELQSVSRRTRFALVVNNL
jgi:hypothetical protein